MIRAKSSTTQVCFICGVPACEIRGLLLCHPRTRVYPSAHDDLSTAGGYNVGEKLPECWRYTNATRRFRERERERDSKLKR